MANIGGGIRGTILVNEGLGFNDMGEKVEKWTPAFKDVLGWLGLQAGDSKRVNFSAKLEESTHVFLCDFHAGIYALADKDTRMIFKGNTYDVQLIDNPDEMDEQLEIYLRKVGASNG